MIHLDRLHKAICRLTGSPFAHVYVATVVAGQAGCPKRWIRVLVRGEVYHDGSVGRELAESISEIKKDHGWNSSHTQGSSSQSSQSSWPASGLHGSHALDRRPLHPESGSRART